MDQLKIAQTKPTFTVYPNNTQKKFTQYDDLSTSSEQVYSPDYSFVEQTNNSVISSFASKNILSSDDLIISSSSQSTKKKNKRPLIENNFSNYRKNKERFYVNAALHIGGKTSALVHGKIQSLVRKYTEEKKEETGKRTSKWPYFYLMNEIFGNRENVQPESLIDSTGKHYVNNDESFVQHKKKAKLNDNELAYIESIAAISESRKKWNEDRAKIEQLEKIKENGKIELEKFKYELEVKTSHELKMKEIELKLKEMELKEIELKEIELKEMELKNKNSKK
ncbi:15332_t:CDS:2 [Dentiscutata heterogama]|uniref:15332_t:CDS:1 n=1 Tax=Dentiscutata heterogama TaxID=1316150 RepID=A0ACA9K246_9GLOM|nr:15332_t:CDS:2 [Dentiscutata heterogama]